MGFRFRRSARLGPLRFNFGKSGLSSISLGGRGASFNIPVARSGGPRSTDGLPGTGLSWSALPTAPRTRGHLHTVLHGEKRQSRRMQWFQPVYVGLG